MAELDHEKISVLAHQLWENDGRPEGRADDYWHAAVKLLSEDADTGDTVDPVDALPPILPLVRPL